jgi:hypothetical protein
MSRESVDRILRLHNRLSDKPHLRTQLESGSQAWTKIEKVSYIATAETEKQWAEKVEADRQKRIEHAKIPGYEVDANIGIPAETEKKAFQESLISTGNLKDSLENIKNEINTNGI